MEEKMETVQSNLEKIENLMKHLDVNEIVTEYESDLENEENPYSDEENPYKYENPYNVKTEFDEEEAETSNNKKRNREERDSHYWQTYNERNPIYQNMKYRRIPEEYKPKIDIAEEKTNLNLDCVIDANATISRWFNKIGALLQLNDKFKELDQISIFNYIMYRTEGNVHAYLQDLTETDKAILIGSKAIETLEKITIQIYKQFTGYDKTDESVELLNKKNWHHLVNLSICDMCYLENYICEFEKIYYALTPQYQKQAIGMFFNKLPIEIAFEVESSFQTAVNEGSLAYTLGGRKTAIRNWLKKQCTQETIRKSNIKLCCKNITDPIGKYGCEKPRSSRKKRFKKYPYKKRFRKSSYKRFNKYKKYNPKRYFRKRRFGKKKQQEYCPKGKKDCKCWICEEIGHYANECPQKSKKKEKTEVLKMAFDIGLEPIEELSDIESNESIYSYSSDEESSEEEESSD